MLEDADSNSSRSSSQAQFHLSESQLSGKRKDWFRCVRWAIALLLLACLFILATWLFIDSQEPKAFKIILIITYGILSVYMVTVSVLMVLALRIFVKLLSRSPSRNDLNYCFVWLQVCCVLILSLVWVGHGVFLIYGATQDFDDYLATYITVLLDMVGTICCFFFFLIMARIMFKTSQVS